MTKISNELYEALGKVNNSFRKDFFSPWHGNNLAYPALRMILCNEVITKLVNEGYFKETIEFFDLCKNNSVYEPLCFVAFNKSIKKQVSKFEENMKKTALNVKKQAEQLLNI